MKVEDINVDGILLDKNHTKTYQFITFYTKNLQMQSQDKVDGIIKTYDRIRYSQLSNSYYEVHYSINSKKIMQFLIGLIIL